MVTETQIQKLAKVVSKETDAVKLYLFGSYVNGEDIDKEDAERALEIAGNFEDFIKEKIQKPFWVLIYG